MANVRETSPLKTTTVERLLEGFPSLRNDCHLPDKKRNVEEDGEDATAEWRRGWRKRSRKSRRRRNDNDDDREDGPSDTSPTQAAIRDSYRRNVGNYVASWLTTTFIDALSNLSDGKKYDAKNLSLLVRRTLSSLAGALLDREGDDDGGVKSDDNVRMEDDDPARGTTDSNFNCATSLIALYEKEIEDVTRRVVREVLPSSVEKTGALIMAEYAMETDRQTVDERSHNPTDVTFNDFVRKRIPTAHNKARNIKKKTHRVPFVRFQLLGSSSLGSIAF